MIACTNTAQLLIARGLRRGREVAIRAALGATRPRLIRQFLLEGLVLSVCGGAAGLLLAVWIARLLVRMLPERSPILESAQVDARVMGFTLALSVLSALVFAIVPAVKASMSTLGPSLGARSIGPGSRWRHGMLTIEAALSTFLLCAAGLIATNLWNLISTAVGVDADHVTVMQLRLSPQREQALRPDPSRAFQNYLEKIQAMPGVDAAAIAWAPPLLPKWGGVIRIVGEPVTSGDVGYPAYSNSVSPNYFRTLRIPLLAGRSFREDDMRGREPVAIVSQEFARRAGVRNPVGRQLFPGYGPGETITIVGVAGDVRMRNLETAPFPVCYLSYRQLFLPDAYLLVRSALPQGQLVNGVKAAIRSSNPEQAVFNVRTMEQVVTRSVTEPRFQASLVGAFALLALAMAATGMYSVISFLVSQRTSEIAIRVALSAGRCDIIQTVLGTTSLWVAAGLASGLALGLAARTAIRSLTDTESAGSPTMYTGVVLFFVLVTLLAAYPPVQRAIRLDPATALHRE
jgi:putative ABC transport system permease protein